MTVLEGEEDRWWADEMLLGGNEQGGTGASGMMSILSGCITVASAAIVDAGIDCVDLITGGVAAIVQQPRTTHHIEKPNAAANCEKSEDDLVIVLDPNFSEHRQLKATCVVGYLESRDEVTELWVRGSIPALPSTGSPKILDNLIDSAIQAAVAVRLVLVEALKESAELNFQGSSINSQIA